MITAKQAKVITKEAIRNKTSEIKRLVEKDMDKYMREIEKGVIATAKKGETFYIYNINKNLNRKYREILIDELINNLFKLGYKSDKYFPIESIRVQIHIDW